MSYYSWCIFFVHSVAGDSALSSRLHVTFHHKGATYSTKLIAELDRYVNGVTVITSSRSFLHSLFLCFSLSLCASLSILSRDILILIHDQGSPVLSYDHFSSWNDYRQAILLHISSRPDSLNLPIVYVFQRYDWSRMCQVI